MTDPTRSDRTLPGPVGSVIFESCAVRVARTPWRVTLGPRASTTPRTPRDTLGAPCVGLRGDDGLGTQRMAVPGLPTPGKVAPGIRSVLSRLVSTIRGVRVPVDQTWYMALWDERIGSHGAWDEVEMARSRFAELTSEHPGHEALVRPAHLVGLLATRLEALDPHVATAPLLDGIESKVQQLRTQVVNVFEPDEGQEAATVEQVNAAAESLAQHIATLPPAGSAELAPNGHGECDSVMCGCAEEPF